VRQRFGDLPHARQRDARALFYCQRMIGGLQFDEGPLTYGLGADVGLQGERRRLVQRQFGGQPAEVRLFLFPSGGGPQRQGAGEVAAAQRHPDSPVELGTRGSVGDRDEEASPDEEMLGLDNALLLFEHARLVTSERRVPVGRGVCPVRHRQAVAAFTAAPTLIADLTGHPGEATRHGRVFRGDLPGQRHGVQRRRLANYLASRCRRPSPFRRRMLSYALLRESRGPAPKT